MGTRQAWRHTFQLLQGVRRRTEEWKKVGKNKKREKILSEKERIIKGEREQRKRERRKKEGSEKWGGGGKKRKIEMKKWRVKYSGKEEVNLLQNHPSFSFLSFLPLFLHKNRFYFKWNKMKACSILRIFWKEKTRERKSEWKKLRGKNLPHATALSKLGKNEESESNHHLSSRFFPLSPSLSLSLFLLRFLSVWSFFAEKKIFIKMYIRFNHKQ